MRIFLVLINVKVWWLMFNYEFKEDFITKDSYKEEVKIKLNATEDYINILY